MIRLLRTDARHSDFLALVGYLDIELAERDGDEHAFYRQFNTLSVIPYAVVAYTDDRPVACRALKEFAPGVMEVKRMFTLTEARGAGMASKVLGELENWAIEMGINTLVLETGVRQPEAIGLYRKQGYTSIPNYGQYAGMENSVCFEKKLN